MQFTELTIAGAWEISNNIFEDTRGVFWEAFRNSTYLSDSEINLSIQQVNISKSHKGVIRGIHYTKDRPGQDKLVTALSGSFVDIVVDLRISSATFKQWQAVKLSAENHNSIFLTAGLGHAVLALEDNSTLMYLCSAEYNPTNERGINPFDPELQITWEQWLPFNKNNFILSNKDRQAASLNMMRENESLPS